MRRFRIMAVASLLVLLGTGSAALAGETWTGNANFILGAKQLDDDDWGALDNHATLGAQISFGKKEWPVQIAIDLLGTGDSVKVAGIDIDGLTGELDVGVRKIWERGKARPFVGGGLAFLNAELETEVGGLALSADDDTTGLWIDGGAFWRLGKRFNLGVEARISRGEVTIGAVDIEAGGEHIGLLLGWGW